MIDLNNKLDQEYKKKIAEYLQNRIKSDTYLSAKVQESTKTLGGILAYIKSEAKKQAQDGVAVIDDATVYEWGVHYILEDSLDFEPKKAEPKKEKEKPTTVTAPYIPEPAPQPEKKLANEIGQMLLDFGD